MAVSGQTMAQAATAGAAVRRELGEPVTPGVESRRHPDALLRAGSHAELAPLAQLRATVMVPWVIATLALLEINERTVRHTCHGFTRARKDFLANAC